MALFKVTKQNPSNILSDRFIIPPFSIFDTRQGYWQERKRHWLNLGIKSEIGRNESDNTYMAWKRGGGVMNPETAKKYNRKVQTISIFDPVLCEIAYRWFSRVGDEILDPFAGGSVRGIVASILNRHYVGIDLSEKQILENRIQFNNICIKYDIDGSCNYIVEDSNNINQLFESDHKFNFLFSCPPYYNLELYSTDSRDLSNKKSYDDFLSSYANIIDECCKLLENDSFAVFVVGNLRDEFGNYYDLVGDTIRIFKECGLMFYNDCIIINVAGSLPIRVSNHFNLYRKVGKQHQNFLVFYKGNVKHIKGKFGEFVLDKC